MSEFKSLQDFSTPKKIKIEKQVSNENSNTNEISSPSGNNYELAPCLDSILVTEQIKSEQSEEKTNNENPWTQKKSSDFLFYVCPECDFKDRNEENFKLHSTQNHSRSKEIFIETKIKVEPNDNDDENEIFEKVNKKTISKRFHNSDSDSEDSDVTPTVKKFRKRSSFIEDSDEDDDFEIDKPNEKTSTKNKNKSEEFSSENSELENEDPKKTRTRTNRKSSEKEKRIEELEKLKETRNGRRKGKKKLNFQPKAVVISSKDNSENEEISDNNVDQSSTNPWSSSNEDITDGYDSKEEEENISENNQDFIESDGSEYEKDDFVVTDPSDDSNDESEDSDEDDYGHRSMLEETLQGLRRERPEDIENRENYLNCQFERQLKKSPKKKPTEKVPELDKNIYERLINKLKELAIGKKKDLSDLEILKQFEEVGSAIDDDMESECICGKTGLKYLYFIKNKLLKAKDPVEYATSQPIIVGSECINHWHLANHKNRRKKYGIKNVKPIEKEFMNWLEKGVIGNFRKSEKSKIKKSVEIKGKIKHKLQDVTIWTLTISSTILSKDFEAVQKLYNLKIVKKQNNAIDIKVIVENGILQKIKKNYSEPLTEKDSRHKYFIRFNADDHSRENAGLNFYLGDVKSAKSTVSRSSEPRSGKDFIK